MKRRYLIASAGLLLVWSAGCGDDDDAPPRPTATNTATVTATAAANTPTATAGLASLTPTARNTATPTAPLPPSATPTDADPPTPTASPSPSPRPPQVTYFGISRADDLPQDPAGVDAEGRPIFERVQGQGFNLVLEARRGSRPLNEDAYAPLGGLPGAQIIVSRPLGDGSPAVCDYNPPLIGGVPAVDPPEFSGDQMVEDAINDLGCRVNDGTGVPRARNQVSACTRDIRFEFDFVESTSERQFCLPVAGAFAFPQGDTIVAARAQDIDGNVSAVSEIVIRVHGDVPFECDTGLGERVFTVARPGSALLTSVQEGDVSTDPWVSEPIRICAGPDLGGGVHQLALRESAVIGFPLLDGSVLCVRLSVRGSDGSIDCDGGSAFDVRASQGAGGISPVVVDTGLGLPAGTGAAFLRLPSAVQQLRVGSTPDECAAVEAFPFEISAALTTTTGTAVLTDAAGTPVVSLSHTGVDFDCAQWTSGGPGTLVLPFPAVGTQQGDIVGVLVLQD